MILEIDGKIYKQTGPKKKVTTLTCHICGKDVETVMVDNRQRVCFNCRKERNNERNRVAYQKKYGQVPL